MVCITAVRVCEAEDGGDAAALHVLDRGAVPQGGRRRPLLLQADTHVHLRLRFLPKEEQPVHHIRGN